MNKLLNLILMLIWAIPIQGQISKLDSLLQRAENESYRMKIETYIDISELPISRDTSFFYLNKALSVAKKIKFDSIYPIQFAITVSNYIKGDLIQAKKEIRKGLKTHQYTMDPLATKGHINMLLGVFSEALNQIDSSIYYYDKTLKILENHNSIKAQEITGTTYSNYGNLYLKTGDYQNAIDIYIKADKLSEDIGDVKNRVITLNNIAGAFKEMKEFDKALEYYNNALKLAEASKDVQNIGTTNIGIGEIYVLKKNNDDLALKHFLKATNILERIEFKSPLSAVYQNISELYLNSGNIIKAETYLQNAFSQLSATKDDYTMASVLITKSNILTKKAQFKPAYREINAAINLSRANNYMNLEKEALLKKIKLSKTLNNSTNLRGDYERLIRLKDSIFNIDKIEALSDIETKYNTEKTEKENLQLKADKAEQELVIVKNKNQKYLFGGLASLLAVGLIGFFLFVKKRKQDLENSMKFSVAKARQEQNNVLAKDLHDSKAKALKGVELQLEKLNQKEIAQTVKSIRASIRDISHKISRISFDKSEFDDQLISLVSTYHTDDFQIHMEGLEDIKWPSILDVVKENLFIAIREGIDNAHEHSSASHIHVSFKKEKKQLRVKVSDNGTGLGEDFSRGNGLNNIEMRIQEINGDMKIKSVQKEGLTLHFNIFLT